MAKCRDCDAPIEWFRTQKGKMMPVDSAPSAKGNVRLPGGNGVRCEVLAGQKLDEARAGGEQLHTSHFYSCPNAAERRKR